MTDDQEQADALERYWSALALGHDTRSYSLAPEMIDVVNRLEKGLSPPAPSHAFRQQLGTRIDHHLQQHPVTSTELRKGHGRGLIAAAATLTAVAVILIAAFLGMAALSPPPHPASAAEVLYRAQEVIRVPTGGGTRSFKLTEQTEIWPGNSGLGGFAGMKTVVHITSERWYRAPNRSRTERRYRTRIVNPLVRNSYDYPTLEVSDGKTYSSYDARGRSVQTYRLFHGQSALFDLMPFGRGARSVTAVLHSYKACYAPRLRGTGEVAGRGVFIVDLGPARCQSNSSNATDGRLVLSIDRHTFLVLKSVLYDVYKHSLPYIINTVTRINYGVSIPNSTFTFKVPAIKPAPVATSVTVPRAATLTQLRHLLRFSIFVPTRAPSGLKPQAPQVSPGVDTVVTIDYRDRRAHGELSVADGATLCCIDNDPRKYGVRVKISRGIMGHMLSFGTGFGGLDLWWEQEGTFVAISSPSLNKHELIGIARSMSRTAVPRGL